MMATDERFFGVAKPARDKHTPTGKRLDVNKQCGREVPP